MILLAKVMIFKLCIQYFIYIQYGGQLPCRIYRYRKTEIEIERYILKLCRLLVLDVPVKLSNSKMNNLVKKIKMAASRHIGFADTTKQMLKNNLTASNPAEYMYCTYMSGIFSTNRYRYRKSKMATNAHHLPSWFSARAYQYYKRSVCSYTTITNESKQYMCIKNAPRIEINYFDGHLVLDTDLDHFR